MSAPALGFDDAFEIGVLNHLLPGQCTLQNALVIICRPTCTVVNLYNKVRHLVMRWLDGWFCLLPNLLF